ncbi:flagellin [Deferribacterales bacterium RsTz2092]
MSDAHTGRLVGSDTVSDFMLRGVIKGVDIKFASDIGVKASFNVTTGQVIFTPDATKPVYLHIVDNSTRVQTGSDEGQYIDITIGRMDTIALEIDDVYVVTMEDSQRALSKIDTALERVNSARSNIGAKINRLEYAQNNIRVTKQNTIAAESRIRDLDVAAESSSFTNNQILVNAAVAMLAQANQLPQLALQLIGR